MLKKITISLLFILGLGITGELSSRYASFNQQDKSSYSQTLIGQKCKVILKNGESKHGTLWEIGEDFIIMKLKKGPLYSKEEKFSFSEIDYLEDSNGKIIYIAKLKSERRLTNKFTFPQKVEDTNTKDLVKKKDQSINKSSQTVGKNQKLEDKSKRVNVEGERQIDTSLQKGATFPQNYDLKSKRVKSSKSNKISTSEKAEPGLLIIRRAQNKEKKDRLSVTNSKRSKKINIQNSKAKPNPTNEISQTQLAAQTRVAQELTQKASKIKTLQYQLLILSIASILALVMMVVLKIKGMAGYTYGKHSLFPSRIMKINGNYGVIDQGSEDGVEADDIIRFHRKLGRQIKYVGKGRVIKVVKNYSVIQLVRNNRNGPIEIGDVGLRDRSFILSAVKAFRKYVGLTFKGLAKGFELAAKNLSVETNYPQKEVTIIEQEIKEKQKKKKAKKSKKQKEKLVKSASQSTDDSTLIGFGSEVE